MACAKLNGAETYNLFWQIADSKNSLIAGSDVKAPPRRPQPFITTVIVNVTVVTNVL
jgi:hypothetical protein